MLPCLTFELADVLRAFVERGQYIDNFLGVLRRIKIANILQLVLVCEIYLLARPARLSRHIVVIAGVLGRAAVGTTARFRRPLVVAVSIDGNGSPSSGVSYG